MGDFIFYSLLVGKTAVNSTAAATISSMIGVIGGLIITLTIFSNSNESIPALPIPIILGLIYHFLTLFVIEPILIILFQQFNFIDITFESFYIALSQFGF